MTGTERGEPPPQRLPPIPAMQRVPAWEAQPASKVTLWHEGKTEQWLIPPLLQHFAADPHSLPRDPTESPTRCLMDFIASMDRVFRRPRPPHEVAQNQELERQRIQAGGPQYRHPPDSERSCDWDTWEYLQRSAYRIVRRENRPW